MDSYLRRPIHSTKPAALQNRPAVTADGGNPPAGRLRFGYKSLCLQQEFNWRLNCIR